MRRKRGIWPDHWRRGPDLMARVRTRRLSRAFVAGAAIFGLSAVIGLQVFSAQQDKPRTVQALMAAAAPSITTASAAQAD